MHCLKRLILDCGFASYLLAAGFIEQGVEKEEVVLIIPMARRDEGLLYIAIMFVDALLKILIDGEQKGFTSEVTMS